MSESTDNEEVRAAFRKRVPEVAAGVVELVGVAREPGRWILVTVRSHDREVHPVSVCVGKSAVQIKSIVAELGGDKVSVILWSESVTDLIKHTLSRGRTGRSRTPKVTLDEERHRAQVQVEPETLELMTSNDGVLLKLASRLVGWDIKLLAYDESSSV
jgi:N utilization substance protein A